MLQIIQLYLVLEYGQGDKSTFIVLLMYWMFCSLLHIC